MQNETKINSFEVCFYEYEDSNDVTVIKDRFSGSLALLQHLGGLEDDEGNFLEVNPLIIDRIEAWAIGKGY
jgi:hypothetical protein